MRVSAAGSRLIFDGLVDTDPLPWKLPGRAILADGGKLNAVAVRGSAGLLAKALPGEREYVDADTVDGPLLVRPWKAGDRWSPLSRDGREVKVVRSLRRAPGARIGALWVVQDAKGKIVWIPGERIAHYARLTERTTRAWKLVWTPPAKTPVIEDR